MGCLVAVLVGCSGFGWLQTGGAGDGVAEVVVLVGRDGVGRSQIWALPTRWWLL